MSKSLGNVVSPAEEMQTKGQTLSVYGYHLWTTNQTYVSSTLKSRSKYLKHTVGIHVQCAAAMLAKTTNFEPSKHAVAFKTYEVLTNI